MALTTYAELQTAISQHIDDDSISANVKDFITLAEERHKNEIRIREMINREALTVSNRYTSLPTGFLQGIGLRLLTDPATPLIHVSMEEMTWRRIEGTGQPKFYNIHSQIEVDVSPDTSYSGEIVFYKAETALSDSNTSNNLLARAPGLYLYGALAASAPFLLNDERIEVWDGMYTTLRDSLLDLDRSAQTSGHKTARIIGSTP